MRRVVITGVGLRTPLGNSPTELFDALIAGRSGVVAFPEWAEIEELGTRVGALVPGFSGKEIHRKNRRTMGRVAQLAAAAAIDAVAQSGVSKDVLRSGRAGVAVGSTVGSGAADQSFHRHMLEKGSARGLKSTLFFQCMSHTCATNVALLFGISGEVFSTNAACASGNQAIGMAARRIRSGGVDVMLAGGADELHVTAAVTFDIVGGASRAFNHAPELAPRPFDRDRDGIVVGEGGAVLVLEEREHALARGAEILGEVLGYGATCDAVNMAAPAPGGMVACVRRALDDAGVAAESIDYVNAHATGTRIGDATEAEALYAVFGDRVPVSSSKGHLGHTLGACGAAEAAIALEAMRRGVLPHTRNLENPDVAPLWLLQAPEVRAARRVVSTNFAFGGINAALVLGSGE